MGWLWLVGAIVSEVIGTSALKASEGFTRVLPSVVVALGYLVSFYLLSLTLKEMPVSVAYAVWSGLGTALIALVGVFVMHEPMTTVKGLGVALIIAGTVALNMNGAH